jgi:hypothetical protein
MGVDLFFSRRTSANGKQAVDICSACPVRRDCLTYALESERTDGLRIGIWGGLGPYERTALAKDRHE